jgi:hypothetical protein
VFDSIVEKIKTALHPQPVDVQIDGRNYRVKTGPYGIELGEQILAPVTPGLQLNSLSGFRDAYLAGVDEFGAGKTVVQVVDYNTVELVSVEPEETGVRRSFLRSMNLEKNPFPFDSYQTPEQFLLSLQMGFLPTEEVIQLQKFASALTNESSIGTQDDGYSQQITVKQGAVTRAEVKLPPRIKLMPYRTFREIDPVQSEFIVRLKGAQGALPIIALIPVDAGRWKHDTALLVKYWLVAELPEDTVVIA